MRTRKARLVGIIFKGLSVKALCEGYHLSKDFEEVS